MPRKMKWRRDGTSPAPKVIDLRLAGVGRLQVSSGVTQRDAYTNRVNALREDAAKGGVWLDAVRALNSGRFSVGQWYVTRALGPDELATLLAVAGSEPLADLIRDYLKQSRAEDKAKMRQRLSRYAKSLGKAPSAADVTTASIETFLSSLIDQRTSKTSKTLARGSTVNRYRAVIGGLCTWAVKVGRMSAHPVAGKRVEKRDEPHHRLPELSPDEYRDYMGYIRARRPDLTPIYLLLIHTAPDVGEAFSLPARDVDLDGATITYFRAKTRRFSSVRPRKVPMPSLVVDEMRTHFAEYPLLRGSFVVFAMLKRRDVEMMHRLAATSINRPELTLKDLRHVAAIAWVKAGVHIRLVSRWLGHTSLSQTMKYTDFEPDAETASRMAESAARTLTGDLQLIPDSIPSGPEN